MINNIEIYVNKKKLDIDDDTDLNLSKSFNANSSTEFSYSFKIPSTYNNQCILGFSNSLHVSNKFNKNLLVELYSNGVLIISGTLYIDSANKKEYNCNLVSQKKLELEAAINRLLAGDNNEKKEVYIDEIKIDDGYRWVLKDPSKGGDWENCNLLNKENYPAQYKNLGIEEDCIIYPYALYGKPINYLTGQGEEEDNTERYQQDNTINGEKDAEEKGLGIIKNAQQYLRPAFRLIDIFKTIFINAGFTNFSGNFFNDSRFKDLYQTFQGKEKDYYDRDNQKWSLDLKKNIAGLVQAPGFLKSTLRNIDSEIFEWKPKNYDEFEEERGIKFLCTKLLQPADLTYSGKNCVTTDFNYSGTDWNDIRFKEEYSAKKNNSFNEILIKKAGWYYIKTDFSYEYKAGEDWFASYFGLNENYRKTASNNFSNTDFVNFANNVWEFQIVKHNSDPTLYSDVLSRGNQKNMQNSPFLTVEEINNSNNGRTEYITTRYNSIRQEGINNNNHFADKLILPVNNNTLFVDNEDFVCGFRVGNQGYFPYNNNTPINRSRIGLLLDLPYLDYRYKDDSFSQFQYIDPDKYLKLWKGPRNSTVDVKFAGVTNDFEYYCPMQNTLFNMVRSNNSFASRNEIIRPKGINNQGIYEVERETVNDFPYKDELVTKFWINDNYCTGRYTDNVVVNNLDSGFKIESRNLVWLDEGEYDARFISPVISYNKEGKYPGDEDYNELDTEDYPVAAKTIDYNISFEYIGTSDKEWKPTADKINESCESDKYTYFNQYLPHEKAIDWIDNLKNQFNLDIKIDSDNNEVIVDFSDSTKFQNTLDITPYVDFGNLEDFDSISFSSSEFPSLISFSFDNTEGLYGIGESSGSKIYNIGGGEDEEVFKSNYEFSVIDNILVGNSTGRVTVPTPIICTETVWRADFPYTQTYEYSGSEKARLYYRGSFYNNGVEYKNLDTWLFNETSNKFMSFPVLNIYSTDGIFTTEGDYNSSINLQKPETLINMMWDITGLDNEYVKVVAYLPSPLYNNLRSGTLIKLDDSYFKIYRIDNFDILTTRCEITLIPLK